MRLNLPKLLRNNQSGHDSIAERTACFGTHTQFRMIGSVQNFVVSHCLVGTPRAEFLSIDEHSALK